MAGTAMPTELATSITRPRYWRQKRLLYCVLSVLLLYGAGIGLGMPVATPFDVLVNLPPISSEVDLLQRPDAKHTLVVLQHGLWRSSWSMWRLERALLAAGYSVLNPCYPSTNGTLSAHALRLRDAIEAQIAAHGEYQHVAFVGHSMGGLVIEEYLRLASARTPFRCIYIATPHRGAVLCDLRKNWWPYPFFMGTEAAMQISPGDPFHQQPILFADCSGTIIGDIGEGSESIKGHDDGTVGTGEAALAGAVDSVTLPFGHTAISEREAMLTQVLHFLREGKFSQSAVPVTR
ncbi:MAG: alpha/beta hydrolase [Planctomycetota bacterium]|nr:alpha/beta hydrolase [Planctomycetota bacterium]